MRLRRRRKSSIGHGLDAVVPRPTRTTSRAPSTSTCDSNITLAETVLSATSSPLEIKPPASHDCDPQYLQQVVDAFKQERDAQKLKFLSQCSELLTQHREREMRLARLLQREYSGSRSIVPQQEAQFIEAIEALRRYSASSDHQWFTTQLETLEQGWYRIVDETATGCTTAARAQVSSLISMSRALAVEFALAAPGQPGVNGPQPLPQDHLPSQVLELGISRISNLAESFAVCDSPSSFSTEMAEKIGAVAMSDNRGQVALGSSVEAHREDGTDDSPHMTHNSGPVGFLNSPLLEPLRFDSSTESLTESPDAFEIGPLSVLRELERRHDHVFMLDQDARSRQFNFIQTKMDAALEPSSAWGSSVSKCRWRVRRSHSSLLRRLIAMEEPVVSTVYLMTVSHHDLAASALERLETTMRLVYREAAWNLRDAVVPLAVRLELVEKQVSLASWTQLPPQSLNSPVPHRPHSSPPSQPRQSSVHRAVTTFTPMSLLRLPRLSRSLPVLPPQPTPVEKAHSIAAPGPYDIDTAQRRRQSTFEAAQLQRAAQFHTRELERAHRFELAFLDWSAEFERIADGHTRRLASKLAQLRRIHEEAIQMTQEDCRKLLSMAAQVVENEVAARKAAFARDFDEMLRMAKAEINAAAASMRALIA